MITLSTGTVSKKDSDSPAACVARANLLPLRQRRDEVMATVCSAFVHTTF